MCQGSCLSRQTEEKTRGDTKSFKSSKDRCSYKQVCLFKAHTRSTANPDLLRSEGKKAPSLLAHYSLHSAAEERTFYRVTARPATRAGPQETETKRTSKLPAKTISSLYFIHQFPAGSMSHPSPWYPCPLLFALPAIKAPGRRLEQSQRQCKQEVTLRHFFSSAPSALQSNASTL